MDAIYETAAPGHRGAGAGGLPVPEYRQRQPELQNALALDAESRVLVLGTEGATDPEIYLDLVGRTSEKVAAG